MARSQCHPGMEPTTGQAYASVPVMDPQDPATSPELEQNVEMLAAMIRGGMPPKTAHERLRAIFGDGPAKAALTLYEKRTGMIRTLTDPVSFSSANAPAWYAGPGPSDRFWPALKRYLLEDKHWPAKAVDAIDTATTKTLALMQHPGLGRVNTKGLVVGYVQSGKTANYTALIAKAADVGYRLFIVLAGIHNSLRRQTERRLRSELTLLNDTQWANLTSLEEDFRPSAGGNTNAFLADGSHLRILCVVKKNAYVLRRLLKWLRAGSAQVLGSCPVLIIDDESDQAGLNSSGDPNSRTVINRQILEIIDLLPKVAYVGYTATPFANVLVDPSGKDLYPSSFIVSLPRPEGYFGAESLFGREPLDEDDDALETSPLDMIRTVPDDEVGALRPTSRAKRDDFEPHVTPSLEDALDYFVLACAARRARGQNDHCSMLVHTTLYADAHERIAQEVKKQWESRKRAVSTKSQKVLARLQQLWESELPRVPQERWGHPRHDFAELQPLLLDVLKSTAILVENGQSLDRLDYETMDAKIQIAVGGNTLSRGLTLEGLLVSFFIRSATAYDTLLQMGRWFGYRFGYEDLPRIWMTSELQDAFHALATVEQEIRNDIKRYDRESLTPEEFGVRIRTHPKLAITATLKMEHAVDCDVSYASTVTQTRSFKHADREWLDANIEATRRLLARAGKPERSGTHYLFRAVQSSDVLDFLGAYRIHEDHVDLQRGPLLGYIRAQNTEGFLRKWNVALIQRGGRDEALGRATLGEGLEVNLLNRSRLKSSNGKPDANLGTITSQGYFLVDIPKERWPSDRKQQFQRTPDDPPLLVLLPISPTSSPSKANSARVALDAVAPIIGLGIAFPGTSKPTPQRYKTVDLSRVERDQEEPFEDTEAEEATA